MDLAKALELAINQLEFTVSDLIDDSDDAESIQLAEAAKILEQLLDMIQTSQEDLS